jgi:acetoin utilization deacetylase AcuC-like enzyme
MRDEGVDVVLYNAGVDPHVGDAMIRGVMTTDQMAVREHAVFGTCLALGMPLAWTTAGGYQKRAEDTVALHDLAMAACVAAMGLEPA